MSRDRLSLSLALLAAVGCTTLQTVRDPAQFIPRTHPRVVYITYTDNSSVYVTEPRISGDSLFGMVARASDSVAVPLHDVVLVQALQRDKTGIILFLSWVAASAAVAAYGYNPDGTAARP